MPGNADLEIVITILTRHQMNTGTPRLGPWTYHHVLPVRIYYSVASLILRILVHEDCWKSTRALGLNTLANMCNNLANKNAIRTFVTDHIGEAVTADEFNDMAKRCASPPSGGFGGPNPTQRTDDPHDGEETTKPISASQVWWTGLKRVSEVFYAAFQLNAMPQPNQVLRQTKKIYEWCQIVEELCIYLDLAETAGAVHMDYSDWVCDTFARTWTLVPAGLIVAPPGVNEPMRLRVLVELKQYRQLDTLDLNETRPRSPVFLARSEDYLKVARSPP